MKVNLSKEIELRSEPISLGDAGEFHLHLKPPTYEDLIADVEKFSQYTEKRLQTCVVGWAGLTEEVPAAEEGGEPTEREIPFSWENFQRLCRQYPSIVQRVAVLVGQMYRGSESAKNVKAASGPFSADAVIAQLQGRVGLHFDGSGISPGQQASPPSP